MPAHLLDATPELRRERYRGIKRRSQKRRYDVRKHDAAYRVALMWYRAKRRAKVDGIPFSIGREHITVPEFCPVLGLRLEWSQTPGPKDNSPSLDRIVPELGYVPGNVVVVSQRANRIKNDASFTELQRIVDFYAGKLVRW